jgi:uncharacterized Tic20 family protein
MSTADELQKLRQLHESGALSDEEYAQAKARLLNSPPSGVPVDTVDVEQQTRTWAMILHLSQFAGYFLVPLAGLIAPIIIWQVKKAELPEIDAHGKVVMNWIISAFLYGLLCFVLCFVLAGIPLFAILGVMAIVFPIIGAIKASSGEVWRYPLSITFFK